MTATHPTDRELEDFLLGKLIAPDDLAVESHLAECTECRDRAVQTPADDTLTELLVAARTLVDIQRSAAPTPTLDGATTPPAFAPTLAWDGTAAAGDESKPPPALANHPKYRVVRRLGSGGMGTVWLAEHLVMHRQVAVKVIRPDLLARPGATNRFLREVRAAAKLHHPNIVTAFDAEPVGDSCLLVMEYVPGQTLGERLEAGPLPVGEACRVIRDAAGGLAHAHSAGLVHRDVKPHNLIRAADGTTKVLDFGLAGVGAGEVIAASGDGLTGAGMVVGTPDYIAPEQINNPHAADARADIYGLGCALYHLLAGRPPLPDGSVAEKLAAQPTHQPDPIPDLPPGLADVLAKMMAKRPEDRYQTADELIAALEPYSGPLAPRAGTTRGASGPHWLRWLALAAGILLVTAGAVIFKIERDNQIVQVEVNDPDIEVVMKRKGEIVLIRDAKTNQTFEYDMIKHQIGMVDHPDGLRLEVSGKEPFVLRRKGERVFTITRGTTWANLPDLTRAAKMDDATKAAEAWFKLYDAGDFARAWDESGTTAHRKHTRDDFIRTYQFAAQKTGKARSRSLVDRQYLEGRAGVRSERVAFSYRTDFELDKGLEEFILVELENDGRWRFVSYIGQKGGRPLGDPFAPPLNPGNHPPLGTGAGGPDLSTTAPRLVQTIPTHEPVFNLAYTPDGKWILAASRGRFTVHDPAADREVFADNLGFVTFNMPLAVSADGHTAAVGSGDVFVYDLTARKRLTSIPRPSDRDRPALVTALALAKDGQKLAYLIGREMSYHDLSTGLAEHTRPADDRVHPVSVGYSRDGRYLVDLTQNETDNKSRVSVRDAKTQEPLGRRELAGLFHRIDFAADGKRLFVSGPARFAVLGLPDAEIIEQDDELPTAGAVLVPSADGALLAIARKEGDVRLWDRAKKRVIASWTPHMDTTSGGKPIFPFTPPRVAFAPDGRTLATARGNQIRVWDLASDGPAKSDRELILGGWRVVAAELSGPIPKDVFDKIDIDTIKPTLTFTPDKVLAKPQGTVPKPFLDLAVANGLLPKDAATILANGTEGVYHLDPTKSPKQIDFTILGEVKKTGLGIYELDADTLKLCMSIDPAKVDRRPTEFATKAGEMRVVLTLKRLTGAERPKTDAPPPVKK